MRKAIEDQWVQRQIQDVAFERQREQEEEERVIVGVNKYQVDEEQEVDIEEVSAEEERRQKENVAAVREERDDADVEQRLDALREAARGDENLMPYIIDAVKAYATTGEVCDAMRDVFGEHQPGM